MSLGGGPVACFPPCNAFCVCIDDNCVPSPVNINAVQLQTLDGRFLTAIAPGAPLTATPPGALPSTRTFYLQPPTPLPPRPGAPFVIRDHDPIAMLGMDAAFAPIQNDFIRVQHTPIPGASPRGGNALDFLIMLLSLGLINTTGRHESISQFMFGGALGWVYVSTGFTAGPLGYPGSQHPNTDLEKTFTLRKQGGGQIQSGDVVSIQVDPGVVASGIPPSFFFRVDDSPSGGGHVIADSTVPFAPNSSFVVTFTEVRPGVGVRPAQVTCQACARVRVHVSNAASGAPVPGATVTARGVLDGTPFTYQGAPILGANGEYGLYEANGRGDCVPAGAITVTVDQNRYKPSPPQPVQVPDTGSIDVTVQLDCTLVTGCVKYDDGTPDTSQPDVFLTDSSNMLSQVKAKPDGTFTFACVLHGPASLWTNGVVNPLTIPSVPPAGLNLPNCLIRPRGTGADIVGTVTICNTSPPTPLDNARVDVVGTSRSAYTGQNGHYTISGVVPAGPYFVTASCPGYRTKFTQTPVNVPSAGQVTVDFCLDPEPALFSTGVTDDKAVLTGGKSDPHWTLVAGPPGVTVPQPATVVSNPSGDWFQTSPARSAWVSAAADASMDVGAPYTFEQQFDLTGINLATVTISGTWSADNAAVLLINGSPVTAAQGTGTLSLTASDPANFHTPHDFTISSGFVPGRNRIAAQVTNEPAAPEAFNPGGFNVSDLTVSYTP